MTQTNKLIVGAVVVLGAYYLYDRNKKMKAIAQAQAQAEVEEAQAEAEALAQANANIRANAFNPKNVIAEIEAGSGKNAR